MNNTKSGFSIRLRELRQKRKMSQSDLAKTIGMSKSSINMYERGEREPGLELIELIADTFNVDLDYLMGRSDIENRYRQQSESESTAVKIPVLGRVVAGIPLEAVEEILDYEEIPRALAENGEYFALQIKGDSMEPRMKDGDVVIVRQQEDVENGDIAIVLVNGNDATVKKIKHTSTGLQLLPTNPAYDPLFFSADEIESLPVCIIGKVVELRAKF